MKLQFAQVRQGLWLALTSLCAMSLALILGIEHPLWAAMPVWAMSQPTRGLLLEQGLFRLLGTILGAVIGLGIWAASEQVQRCYCCHSRYYSSP